MAFILLGSVGYAKLAAPTAFELQKKMDYAEHQVAAGKPLLQFMGESLDGVTLSFSFHREFVAPQRAWNELVALAGRHAAFPLTMGDGHYLGRFVVAGLTRTATVMTDHGALIAIGCQVTLKEWADPRPLETMRIAKQQVAPAVARAGRTRPKSRQREIPQLDVASRAAGYQLVDRKQVVRQG